MKSEQPQNKARSKERAHFYYCMKCGKRVDKRDLADVIFHEDHKTRISIKPAGVRIR
jgi:hypothetical protein